MSEIKLDKRLQAVASMVRPGKILADIGTDHAYLVCYLLQNGVISHAIASDLRKGPLENARGTILESGLTESVELILSDGLENIKPYSCDDIVLAGMGGILIADILRKAPWIYNNSIHIVAQPMTHAEVLREFFVTEGFEIVSEKAVTDMHHCYCVISARYCGERRACPESYAYLGEMTKNSDGEGKAYVMKVHKAISKKANALRQCGKGDEYLEKILSEIEVKIKEAGLWQE